MKLKTIVDLKGYILPMVFEKDKPINQVNTDELKEEAIKHIKDKTCNEGFGLTPDTVYWIKYFFNITEEDLK